MASLNAEQGGNLLKTCQYSDLTLVCGEREFHIHKAVVCPQSAFFSTCVKETFKEGQDSRIDMQEAHPGIIAAALLYMYTGDITSASLIEVWGQEPPTSSDKDGTEALKAAADLCQLADRLMIPALKTHACQRFRDRLQTYDTQWLANGNHEARCTNLVTVLEYVYQTASSSDMGIRLGATGYALGVVVGDSRYSRLGQVLCRHENMAWMVMKDQRKFRYRGGYS